MAFVVLGTLFRDICDDMVMLDCVAGIELNNDDDGERGGDVGYYQNITIITLRIII